MVSIYNLTAISVYRWVIFKEKVTTPNSKVVPLQSFFAADLVGQQISCLLPRHLVLGRFPLKQISE